MRGMNTNIKSHLLVHIVRRSTLSLITIWTSFIPKLKEDKSIVQSFKQHFHCAQNTIMPKIQRHHLYSAKLSIQLPSIKSSFNYNHTIIKESLADTLYNHQLEANKLETWQTLRGASTWYNIMQRMTISHISIGNTIAVSYCTRSYISCS